MYIRDDHSISSILMFSFFAAFLIYSLTGCGNLKGEPGSQGPVGAPGLSIVSTQFPANTNQCSNGGTVLIFGQDVNGTGVFSSNDADQMEVVVCNGNNGSDAQSVSAVQLCPHQGAPSFGNFPEVGFCIGGVLYGLFEDSHGNLSNSPLSSGNYHDVGNNQSCNFTINGCSVTQN